MLFYFTSSLVVIMTFYVYCNLCNLNKLFMIKKFLYSRGRFLRGLRKDRRAEKKKPCLPPSEDTGTAWLGGRSLRRYLGRAFFFCIEPIQFSKAFSVCQFTNNPKKKLFFYAIGQFLFQIDRYPPASSPRSGA